MFKFLVVTTAAGLGEIFPIHQVVLNGQPLKIICNSDSIVKWQFIRVFTTRVVHIKKRYIYGNVIYMPKASHDDNSGTYICNGYSDTGKKFVVSSVAYVACKQI